MKLKGIYILVLELCAPKEIAIGKAGINIFDKGIYIYIGSAVGPGGIEGRLKHHYKISDKPHWHIDYLRKEADLINVFFFEGDKELEHLFAIQLSKTFRSPIPKFGSSDCNCYSHLFFNKTEPSFLQLQKITGLALLKYNPN